MQTGERSRPERGPRIRRRDRHGRGLRGVLAPQGVPLHRTRSERFDDLVLQAVARLEPRWEAELAEVEFAVEEIPPALPPGALPGPVPLARLDPGVTGPAVAARPEGGAADGAGGPADGAGGPADGAGGPAGGAGGPAGGGPADGAGGPAGGPDDGVPGGLADGAADGPGGAAVPPGSPGGIHGRNGAGRPEGQVTDQRPADRPPRIVVYRRPLMARAEGEEDLGELVFDVVVEEFARLLGVDPEDVDPGYAPDD